MARKGPRSKTLLVQQLGAPGNGPHAHFFPSASRRIRWADPTGALVSRHILADSSDELPPMDEVGTVGGRLSSVPTTLRRAVVLGLTMLPEIGDLSRHVDSTADDRKQDDIRG